jgi:hypothetical protein
MISEGGYPAVRRLTCDPVRQLPLGNEGPLTAHKTGRNVLPGKLPETPEERRGDAADAMFQEMKRLIEEEVAKQRK